MIMFYASRWFGGGYDFDNRLKFRFVFQAIRVVCTDLQCHLHTVNLAVTRGVVNIEGCRGI